MSKFINIYLEINTEALRISVKETFHDLYYNPPTIPDSKGIPFDKIQLVLCESAGTVSIKPEREEYYAKALDHWLAWRHGSQVYYHSTTSESRNTSGSFTDNYARYVDNWLDWKHGKADKPDLMTSSQPRPEHVDDAAINEVNDLIYRICGYISMNYMKNIGKKPVHWTSEELGDVSDKSKHFKVEAIVTDTAKRLDVATKSYSAFSEIVEAKVADGVVGYKEIDTKTLVAVVTDTVTELYRSKEYNNIGGITIDMVNLALEEKDGKVWFKPEYEKLFIQALDLWLARRCGVNFKYSSASENDAVDKDTASVRVLVYQLCACISEDYMKKIIKKPIGQPYPDYSACIVNVNDNTTIFTSKPI